MVNFSFDFPFLKDDKKYFLVYLSNMEAHVCVVPLLS